MKIINYSLLTLISLTTFTGCDVVERFEEKSARINKYENVALHLSKETRELKSQISELKFEIQKLKSEKSYLKIQLGKLEGAEGQEKSSHSSVSIRNIASVPGKVVGNDLVNYDIYKWTPVQVLAMAEKEFDEKNYEKSAQFFNTFVHKFKNNKEINDQLLFQAGVAAYESGNHSDWVFEKFGRLVKEYPTSKYYRGAKLWMALTHLKLGDTDQFFNTVEEFRKKYRNTSEWKVLSQHYEKIVQNYKK